MFYILNFVARRFDKSRKWHGKYISEMVSFVDSHDVEYLSGFFRKIDRAYGPTRRWWKLRSW